MRITKFVHSCLLVEADGLTALIDPGKFTYDSHLIHLKKLPTIDRIIITHEHSDHYFEPFLRTLSKTFPHAAVITNEVLAEKINKLGIRNEVKVGSDDNIIVFEADHEPLPLDMPNVANIGVHIADKLTHPGDSFSFTHCRDVLALPMTGPWGSLKEALNKVVELKPKAVIPTHDWEWHRAARESRYQMSRSLLEPHDIKFIELENSISTEI